MSSRSRRCRAALANRRPKPSHCPQCGAAAFDRPPVGGEAYRPDLLTVDHILPRHAGGSNRTENLRWLCVRCNRSLIWAGNCVGALACARAAIGTEASVSEVMRWFSGARHGLRGPRESGSGPRAGRWDPGSGRGAAAAAAAGAAKR